MTISEKIIEIKKIIELTVKLLPEIVSLIKELVTCIKDLKSV